jgi:hypothetical protein
MWALDKTTRVLQMHSALMENVHNKVDGFLTSDRRQRRRRFVLNAEHKGKTKLQQKIYLENI